MTFCASFYWSKTFEYYIQKVDGLIRDYDRTKS